MPDDYEAPEDVARIKWAAANMGDYKLKTSEEYLGEKITTAKRRQRVMDLKRWVCHVNVFTDVKNILLARFLYYLKSEPIFRCTKK